MEQSSVFISNSYNYVLQDEACNNPCILENQLHLPLFHRCPDCCVLLVSMQSK